MAPKPKLLTNRSKTPLTKLGASASKKKKNPLTALGAKKRGSKTSLPEPAFAIPGFGDTGMTGES